MLISYLDLIYTVTVTVLKIIIFKTEQSEHFFMFYNYM